MIISDIIRVRSSDFYVDIPYEIIEIINHTNRIIVVDNIIKHICHSDYVSETNMINESECYIDVVSMRKRKLKKLLNDI